MYHLKEDMARIQTLVGKAFTETGGLLAMADGAYKSDAGLQRKLEQTMEHFEKATLELRTLCEKHSPGTGQYGTKPLLPAIDITGYVEVIGYHWFHICLNTLLPHCRFQSPKWLFDSIRRILANYEATGKQLPYYRNGAVLVIEECSNMEGRQVFDQDNKGWKTISNALKGWMLPDDDQYSLGVVLLSTPSTENVCHITLLEKDDVGDFFSLRYGYSASGTVYRPF